MEKTAHDFRAADTLEAWQQALAEVPQTPALSGALLRRRDDLFGRFAAWYGRLRSRPRAERRRWQRQLGLSLAGVALVLAMHGPPAGAADPTATITVTNGTSTVANGDGCSLPEAIINANANSQSGSTDCAAGSGAADIISLSTNVTLTAVNNTTNGNNGLPPVTSTITIEGNSRTISRQADSPDFRIMLVGSGGDLTLRGARVSGGVSGNGGAIYVRSSGRVEIYDSTLSGNSATNNGGGIYAISSRVEMDSTFLLGNSASSTGGAIGARNSTVTVMDSRLSGNSAGSGGGINAFSASLAISNSTLSGNSSTTSNGEGGGIRARYGSLAISNSTLSGNSSANDGAGIFAFSASLAISNGTLSGNSANGGGGGIYNRGSTVTVSNSTLSGNSATFGGGIRSNTGAAVLSSIVALQNGGGDCDGVITTGGYNIESGTSCGFAGTGDLQNVSSGNLALGALANNGGRTQTMALGLTSVAVDRIPVGALEANGCGVTVTTDQRGLPRASGATAGGPRCDVGAFEVQVPLAVTLASFDAQAMIDRIQLSWETVSEMDNAGFNLYRSPSPAAPDALLAFVPSQAPGSTQGASYSFDDTDVSAGQTWYYWLEDVDLNGATSLHGPVSATLQAPTAVTLDALQAQAASPGSATTWGALAAALIAAAGVLGVRRRSRAR